MNGRAGLDKCLIFSLRQFFYFVLANTKEMPSRQRLFATCLALSVVANILLLSLLFSAQNACQEAPRASQPICPTLLQAKGDEGEPPVQESVDAKANPAVSDDSSEEGWSLGLERRASKTDNTIYDPAEDKALQVHPNRYARSPVPKGSWRIRVGPKKWVTMDEVAFAYDVWFEENQIFQYMSWMGVFIQQDPSDAFAIQDMLWRVKPDLVIEIGTNTGGGAIFYATIMRVYNPSAQIVTLDVKPLSNWNSRNNMRCPDCTLADKHPFWKDGTIHFIQGRVTEKPTHDAVDEFVKKATRVLVIEDASHRYPDTLQNMEAIHDWVTPGSYMLVQDTKMDRFVALLNKKYAKLRFGPMRSVNEFLTRHSDFVIDRRFEYLLYSQHHRGFLRKREKV